MAARILLLYLMIGLTGWAEEPGQALQKIQDLGLADESLAPTELPERWLTDRGEAVRPLLIRGLDDPTVRIAGGCLDLLAPGSSSPEVLEALLRIGQTPGHVLRARAILLLIRHADDSQARQILSQAVDDGRLFPDPLDRSRLTLALGDPERAVHLVLPLVHDRQAPHQLALIIAWLGKIDHALARQTLTTLSGDRRWTLAAAAHLALARSDPSANPERILFLEQWPNLTTSEGQELAPFWRRLPAAARTRLRPLLLQALGSDLPLAGLNLLVAWREREAVPLIRRRLGEATVQPKDRCGLAGAYLDLTGPDASLEELQAVFGPSNLGWLVARSGLPAAGKTGFLCTLGSTLEVPALLRLIQGLRASDPGSAEFLRQTMRDSRNLAVQAACADKVACEPPSFAPELALVLRRALATDHYEGDGPDHLRVILQACARQPTATIVALAQPLLAAEDPDLRLAAAALVARSGQGDRTRSLRVLLAALDEHRGRRQEAVACLEALPCCDDGERQQREQAVLAHVGRPSEDGVLRLLTTCCGQAGATCLEQLLQGEDVARAVQAAWILAQHHQEALRTRALRLLAIHALFHQHGTTILFPVAQGLRFRQDLSSGNPPGSLRIPPQFLGPLTLDDEEQAFCFRSYRHSLTTRRASSLPLRLDPGTGAGDRRSYLPLLRLMAANDPALVGLRIRGHLVAHFPLRQQAARLMAAILGQPVTYRGLAGEELDSTRFPPSPYPEQQRRIARFLADRLTGQLQDGVPRSEAEHDRLTQQNLLIEDAVRCFGQGLAEDLQREVAHRGLTDRFRMAGLALWQPPVPEGTETRARSLLP